MCNNGYVTARCNAETETTSDHAIVALTGPPGYTTRRMTQTPTYSRTFFNVNNIYLSAEDVGGILSIDAVNKVCIQAIPTSEANTFYEYQ